VFPHVSVASFDAGGPVYMVSQLLPGDHVGESVTVQHFVAPDPLDDERRRAVAELMAFLLAVVRDEDYATGFGIQRGLRAGALDDVVLGRHEAACQRFHSWVDALVAAETLTETAACFTADRGARPPADQPISSASAHA
jgi:Ring hydroxylating alpha subunit (catalytic domain)